MRQLLRSNVAGCPAPRPPTRRSPLLWRLQADRWYYAASSGDRVHRNLVVVVASLFVCSAALAQSWPSVSSEMPAAGGGEGDAAVIVGISAYPFLPEIPGASENASSWAQHFIRVRKIPPSNVLLLRDNEASRERIESVLTLAAKSAKPGGQLWFVFIGHGAPSPNGEDGLILGVDTQPDIESLSARGLPQRRVAELLNGSEASPIAVFDACFSGRSADGAVSLVRGLQATLPVRRANSSKLTILASSETFAGPLPGVDRPAFSYVLLGALRGWADNDGDAQVTVNEAITWTRNSLQAALKGTGRLPSLQEGSSSTVLATNVSEKAPDVDAIVIGRCPDGMAWGGRECEASGSLAAGQVVNRPSSLKGLISTTSGAALGVGVVALGLSVLPASMIAAAESRAEQGRERALADAGYWQGWYEDGAVTALLVGGGIAAVAGAVGLVAGLSMSEETAQ